MWIGYILAGVLLVSIEWSRQQLAKQVVRPETVSKYHDL